MKKAEFVDQVDDLFYLIYKKPQAWSPSRRVFQGPWKQLACSVFLQLVNCFVVKLWCHTFGCARYHVCELVPDIARSSVWHAVMSFESLSATDLHHLLVVRIALQFAENLWMGRKKKAFLSLFFFQYCVVSSVSMMYHMFSCHKCQGHYRTYCSDGDTAKSLYKWHRTGAA